MRASFRSLQALAGLLTLLLAVAVIPASAAPAPVPEACANGGYATWDRGDGTPFKNENQCAKFVAAGGELVPWASATTATVSVSFIRATEPAFEGAEYYCTPVVTVTGFAVGTYQPEHYAIQHAYATEFLYTDTSALPSVPVTVNGSGAATWAVDTMLSHEYPAVIPEGYEAPQFTAYWYVEAVVAGVSSGEVIVRC
jgi:hypothetical protein